jgi:hypothetical protein
MRSSRIQTKEEIWMRSQKHLCKIALTLGSIFLSASVCLAQESTSSTAQTVAAISAAEVTTIKTANAVIYFYRIKQYAGSMLEPSVYCDDKELARMDNGRYFVASFESGKHTCHMGDKQTGFELDLKPGEQYYAKVTIDVGLLKGHGRLSLLTKEQGAFELKKVKPLGRSKVKDRTLVTVYEGSEPKQAP